MKLRIALVVLALSLAAACNQQTAPTEGADAGPQLDSPAPESEPSRVFAPSNDAARTATGQVTESVSTRLPDAGAESGDAQEVLTLRGATGVVLEAQITGAVSPATQVGGQTLRALLNIPVEEPQVLVYRVTNETKPDGGQGICGAESAAFVVVWEPTTPGDSAMKLLGVMGAAPGAANSRACPLLAYARG